MLTPSERLEHAAALAKQEIETAFARARDHLIDMEVHSLRSSVATLCFAWIDRANRPHITANKAELIEQRDHLSRLIEKIEAQEAHQEAAE